MSEEIALKQDDEEDVMQHDIKARKLGKFKDFWLNWDGTKVNIAMLILAILTVILNGISTWHSWGLGSSHESAKTTQQSTQVVAAPSTEQPTVPIKSEVPKNVAIYCEKFVGAAALDPNWPLWSSARSTGTYGLVRVTDFTDDHNWSVNLNIGDLKVKHVIPITVTFFYLPRVASEAYESMTIGKGGWIQTDAFPPNAVGSFPVQVTRPLGGSGNGC